MESIAEPISGKAKQDNPVFCILLNVTLAKRCLVAACDIAH